MNWYNFYKISYNVSRDDVLASELSQNIFSAVKENMFKNTFKEMKVDDKCNLQLYFSFGDYGSLRYETFDIEGYTAWSDHGYFEPYIRIDLKFDNRFSDRYFDKLNYVVYDAVKHELDHYRQYKQKEKHERSELPRFDPQKPIVGFIAAKNNILSEGEILPYIRGLVYTSKKQKVPFEIILDKSIDDIFFGNNKVFKSQIMSSVGQEINRLSAEIKLVIMARAKQLYPYLRKTL
jgi:hypothetical protein